MTLDDHAYYARRAQQEVDAASNAACDAACWRHQELAEAYRFRCALILAELRNDASATTVIDHPMRTRQPIVKSNTTALAANPAAAPRPVCRA